ncbi:unnamed protein product, partial [Staurois parvus]
LGHTWKYRVFSFAPNSETELIGQQKADDWSTDFFQHHGRTDNSWGPQAIGDHGAPVPLPKLKKAYEKGTRGISWGPLLTLGPRAVP